MPMKAHGVFSAVILLATLNGCSAGYQEPKSSGEHGGGYATSARASSGNLAPPYQQGIAALQARKFDRASRAFDALLAAQPDSAEANYLAGLARAGDSNLKGALKYFLRAAKYDESMIAAYQQIGVAQAKLGREKDAQATLDLLGARATVCAQTCVDALDLTAAMAAVANALGRDAAVLAVSELPVEPPLHDARWLAPGTPITVLAREPSSCLVVPRDENAARIINVGRAAFRTPALLGGKAASLGLSCAVCHRNGRTNPAFHYPGVSGEPGTADVTTSIFSSHRGDRTFNPRPIPDLAAPERKRIISHDPASGALETFIFGVVVKEFDGAYPPDRVLEGLSAYVRAISPHACSRDLKVTLATDLNDMVSAIDVAGHTWAEGDPPTARLMVASARTSLGKIDERYATVAMAANRRAIRSADLDLQALQSAIDNRRPDIPARIASWRLDMDEWARLLKRDEKRSLYNPAVLSGKQEQRYR